LEPRIIERAEHPVSRRDIDPNVLRVLYRLIGAGHLAYLVGGGVRDLMIGQRPKDFDVATSAHPQQVRDLFRNSRLIGRRFRLVHVFFGPKNIEVATFRRRSEEGSGSDDPLIKLDNTFGTPEEDAFRRDFTINSLFYDPATFRVIDYAGGVEDLHAKLIRTIGDPEIRMREDPVRMMRAVRFAARLGFEIEPATRAAIERHRGDLLKASMPRLVEETYRTLGQPGAGRATLLMEELGLLEPLVPFLSEQLRAYPDGVARSPGILHMRALGELIGSGFAADHAFVLSAMFFDLARSLRAANAKDFDLLAELRLRGFARGDTDRMRLIIDAFDHLASPSRRTRRLMRRPYFPEAHRFFEMAAPAYAIDSGDLRRFLSDPEAFFMHRQPPPSQQDMPPGHRRRRRRRRRGRQPRLPINGASAGSENRSEAMETMHQSGEPLIEMGEASLSSPESPPRDRF
jgi:poly(A) polymerase